MSFVVETSTAYLNYPPYALSFDPEGTAVLAVAGGGGRSRTGVKNMVSLFNFSDPNPNATAIAEHEFGAGEDSPTTVAALRRTGRGTGAARLQPLAVLAGVNEVRERCVAGKNASLRLLEVTSNQRRLEGGLAPDERDPNIGDAKSEGKEGAGLKAEVEEPAISVRLSSKGGSALFSTPDDVEDRQITYHRTLRLSRPDAGVPRSKHRPVGVTSSALAGDRPEIVVFDADVESPVRLEKSVLAVHVVKRSADVDDVDIIQVSSPPSPPASKTKGGKAKAAAEGNYQVVACTKHEVLAGRLTYDFATSKPVGPGFRLAPVFSTVLTGSRQSRTAIRFARFVTEDLLLLACNSGSRNSGELMILKLAWDGPGSETEVEMIYQTSLSRSLGTWSALDVLRLNRDGSSGEMQLAIGAGFSSGTVSAFALNFRGEKVVRGLRTISSIGGLHGGVITGVALSPLEAEGSGADDGSDSPERLKLAASSISRLVTVHYFPLTKSRCGEKKGRTEDGDDQPTFRYKLIPQPSLSVGAQKTVSIMTVLALILAFLFKVDLASSLPASVANIGPALAVLQPVENLQATIQGRDPRVLAGNAAAQEQTGEITISSTESTEEETADPKHLRQKRRNLHFPGSENLRKEMFDDIPADSELGSGKSVKNRNKMKLAEEVRQLIDKAEPGSFLLVNGVPLGIQTDEVKRERKQKKKNVE